MSQRQFRSNRLAELSAGMMYFLRTAIPSYPTGKHSSESVIRLGAAGGQDDISHNYFLMT